MSDTETSPPATQSPNLQGQIEALQRQIFLLLLALVVISATFVFYLFFETHFLSKDYAQLQPQAMQMIRAYSNNRQAINAFHQELSNYAYAHPSFQPVLKKYGWPPPKTATQP
jgi:sensor histidine kinase regulating citrate/malate metabolism